MGDTASYGTTLKREQLVKALLAEPRVMSVAVSAGMAVGFTNVRTGARGVAMVNEAMATYWEC